MFGIAVVVAIVAWIAVHHARSNYQGQVSSWNKALDRAVEEKMKMHQDVAKHVKNLLVQEGFAVRAKDASPAMTGRASAIADVATVSTSTITGEQPAKPKAAVAVTPLQEATGRVVFMGEVPDPVKGYDIFTCRLLGKEGEVIEFRGAQLKGESMRMGDLVTIRRLPSESINQKDGSVKRKNRFEVIQMEQKTPDVTEESHDGIDFQPVNQVAMEA